MTHEVEAAAYILRAMEEIEKNGDPYANDNYTRPADWHMA